jgi:3-methyladenine DNA glycosylase AlkD
MSTQLKEIQQALLVNSSPVHKQSQEKFIPGSQDKSYGVKMPVINDLAKKNKSGGFKLVKELWKAGSLEEKLMAVKILGMIAKKDPGRSFKITEQFAKNIGNWAVCDALGMQGLKLISTTHQKEIFALARKYNRSKDSWQRRLSLVLVEWYTREKKLHPEIMKLVKPLENDEEYYVKKAVIWIKKNFSKGK